VDTIVGEGGDLRNRNFRRHRHPVGRAAGICPVNRPAAWGGLPAAPLGCFRAAVPASPRAGSACSGLIREADLFVGDLDDSAMIRIYARENATQRGNAGERSMLRAKPISCHVCGAEKTSPCDVYAILPSRISLLMPGKIAWAMAWSYCLDGHVAGAWIGSPAFPELSYAS
jgi:hypothetical protein